MWIQRFVCFTYEQMSVDMSSMFMVTNKHLADKPRVNILQRASRKKPLCEAQRCGYQFSTCAITGQVVRQASKHYCKNKRVMSFHTYH